MKPGRIPCEVLGCRRTGAADLYPPGTKLICGKCARLATHAARREFTKAARAVRRLGDDERFVSPRRLHEARWAKHEAWLRLVTEANEAKAGIG